MSNISREWFEKRAIAAKDAIQTFNDDAEERALAWVHDEMIRLRTALESIASKGGTMNDKRYILQYKDGSFFREQNLYLGEAILTQHIDAACQMSLEKAEKTLDCMKQKNDWRIFRVVLGLRLGDENTRHVQKERKKALEQELAKVEKELERE